MFQATTPQMLCGALSLTSGPTSLNIHEGQCGGLRSWAGDRSPPVGQQHQHLTPRTTCIKECNVFYSEPYLYGRARILLTEQRSVPNHSAVLNMLLRTSQKCGIKGSKQ